MIVATHFQRFGDLTPRPYFETFRGVKPRKIALILRPQKFHRFFVGPNIPQIGGTAVWSELGPFLSEYPWRRKDMVGLHHYRCALDLLEDSSSLLVSFEMRNKFLRKQRRAFKDIVPNAVYVGNPMVFEKSAWEQFEECWDVHRNLMPLLEMACSELDLYLGLAKGQSEMILKSKNRLFARNLFIGPTDFALLWARFLIDFMPKLQQKRPGDADERWGAFILERMFSVLIEHNLENQAFQIITKPVIYFENEKISYL